MGNRTTKLFHRISLSRGLAKTKITSLQFDRNQVLNHTLIIIEIVVIRFCITLPNCLLFLYLLFNINVNKSQPISRLKY